ncbi:beta-galactosidase [Anaerolineales bacterium HSG25]|nr:beta-galactosidase [Anaerolineales bacterium HSG25]
MHNPNQPNPYQETEKKSGFNPLILAPIIIGGLLAVTLLCAITFAGGAFFFYQADDDSSADTAQKPTSTVKPVTFSTEDESPAVAEETQPTPAPVEEAPADNAGEESAEPAPDSGHKAPAPAEDTPPDAAPEKPKYPVPTINTEPVSMNSPDFSMQVFLFWQEEIADRDLSLVQDAGFTWVKQEFAWREIEGAGKGIYDWTRTDRIMDQIDAHGLKVIVRLGVQPEWAAPGVHMPEVGPPDNMQDFADFVTAVAERYQGRIDAYQIWNEPNLAREWGERPPNAAEYTELLKIGYESIKAVDPFPIVISAGLAPTTRNDDVARPDTYFIQEMYDAGAAPYFDALGAHGAGYASPPEEDPAVIAQTPGLANPGDFKEENNVPEELRRVYGFRHVEDVRAIMVKNGDEAKKVVLLEFGWTVDPRPDSPYKWHAITQEQQAEYFVNAYQYAKQNWRPWIGIMSLIYVANPQWHQGDEQTYWSIIYPGYPELNAAPAYYNLKDMPKE